MKPCEPRENIDKDDCKDGAAKEANSYTPVQYEKNEGKYAVEIHGL